MKNIIMLILFFFTIKIIKAQPNLYDSIPIYQKICKPISQGGISTIYSKKNHTFCIYGRSVPLAGGGFQYNPTLVKLDHNFDTVWSVMYGGTGEDYIGHVRELPNGNLCLIGHTSSVDGTVTYNPTNSLRMIWVQIVDTNGVVLKAKVFGAYNGGNDYVNSMVSSNGDIYVCGRTLGNDNDFLHINNGNGFNNDGFVMKVNGNLDISWVRFASTDANDGIESISQFSDSKILVTSYNNDSTGQTNLGDSTRGLYDALIKMLDTAGNTLWQKRYGSGSDDVIQNCLYNAKENVIYCVGITNSFSGDIEYKNKVDDTEFFFIPPLLYGTPNAWILVLDTNGNKLHSKAYGDSLNTGKPMEYQNAFLYKNQLITLFNSGDGGGNLPINPRPNTFNAFIAKYDSNANLIGKYCINGTSNDDLRNYFVKDNNYYVYGVSGHSFPYPNNTYSCDTSRTVWFYLKLSDVPSIPDAIAIEPSKPQLSIIPNPSHDKIVVQIPNMVAPYNISIYDVQGKEWLQLAGMYGMQQSIAVANLPAQVYYLKVIDSKGGVAQGSFIKE
jgi:Secretion system C-terminal sorting domain